MADFFVSYNKADVGWAQWIAWQLEEAGYAVVIQAWDFLPGQDYSQRMDETMQSVKRLIAVVSPDWRESKHAKAEWREFYRLDPDAERALILPVLVRSTSMRGLLGGHVPVDLSDTTDERVARGKLLDGVRAVQAKPSARSRVREKRRLKPEQGPPFPLAAVKQAAPRAPVDYLKMDQRSLPLAGVEDELFSVAFSPDGKWLAAGSKGTAFLWDLRHRKRPVRTGGHGSYVYSVCFSYDGQRLATGGEDGFVRVWSVSPLKQLWAKREHVEAVYSVAFSRDGTRVASGSYDHHVLLWDAESGRALRGHGADVDLGRVTSIAFSPDDQWLGVGSLNDNVYLFDVNKRRASALGRHDSSVEGVAFSPDGRYLASCGLDKAVCVWDVKATNGKAKWRERAHEYVVRSVAFAPDGRTLASVGWDKKLILWRADTGDYLASLPFESNEPWHSDWIWSVAFSNEGTLLASSSSDARIVLWQVNRSEAPPRAKRATRQGARRKASASKRPRPLNAPRSSGAP